VLGRQWGFGWSRKPPTNITQLLSSVGKGDAVAASQLLEIVYSELHRLAARYMSRERVDRSCRRRDWA